MPESITTDDFRWDDLRLFLQAHRAGSLTGAARRLSLNQSTTSRRLKALEERLGGRLFDRTPEGLLLTDFGQRLLGPAERAEAASLEVVRLAAGADPRIEGEVRIAVAEGLSFYLVAPSMARLQQIHPGLSISLLVSENVADLTRREADLALRFIRPTRGDLIAKRIYSGGYAIFGSPELRDRIGPGPHALAELPFVGWDLSQSHFPEGSWEAKAGVCCRTRATSMTTRIALAQAGCGVIELAQQWGETLDGLVPIETTQPCPLRAEVWLVTHRAMRDVPRLQAVWDFIENLFVELTTHGAFSAPAT